LINLWLAALILSWADPTPGIRDTRFSSHVPSSMAVYRQQHLKSCRRTILKTKPLNKKAMGKTGKQMLDSQKLTLNYQT